MQKRCSVKPYQGDQPFIFVSYCHKDRPFVFPILESLARHGFRLWYDEGITPGSEWNEVIADHMNRSDMCLAFISAHAVASHNCRREINFALLKNKPLVSVFIEETVLTPGMEMQLSANQCIFSYTYPDLSEFIHILKSVPALATSLGQPDPTIEIHTPSFYRSKEKMPQPEQDTADLWFSKQARKAEYVLIRQASREIIPLEKGSLSVGRSPDSCDPSYIIANNNEISRQHFQITSQDGTFFVTDCQSKNGTFLNGSPLLANVPHKLNRDDVIRASSEFFIFQSKPVGGKRLV